MLWNRCGAGSIEGTSVLRIIFPVLPVAGWSPPLPPQFFWDPLLSSMRDLDMTFSPSTIFLCKISSSMLFEHACFKSCVWFMEPSVPNKVYLLSWNVCTKLSPALFDLGIEVSLYVFLLKFLHCDAMRAPCQIKDLWNGIFEISKRIGYFWKVQWRNNSTTRSCFQVFPVCNTWLFCIWFRSSRPGSKGLFDAKYSSSFCKDLFS